MKPIQLLHKAEKVVRQHSPTILTALGVSGTLTTAYLSAKGAFQSAHLIRNIYEEENEITGPPEALSTRELVEACWKFYIPAGISGTLTVACIIGAARVGSRRTAAITAAYSITEKAFVEYKDKVAEQLGERKEKSFRDSIAQDKVVNNPPTKEIVIVSGKVLCMDAHSGRYFESDMQSLRTAENDINSKLMREMYVSLSEYYYILKLPPTSYSSEIGWTSDKQLKLDFSSAISEDDRPCLVIDFNYIKPL